MGNTLNQKKQARTTSQSCLAYVLGGDMQHLQATRCPSVAVWWRIIGEGQPSAHQWQCSGTCYPGAHQWQCSGMCQQSGCTVPISGSAMACVTEKSGSPVPSVSRQHSACHEHGSRPGSRDAVLSGATNGEQSGTPACCSRQRVAPSPRQQ